MYFHSFFLYPMSGRGGSAGGKFRISLALPVGAVVNCADNTGELTVMNMNPRLTVFTYLVLAIL